MKSSRGMKFFCMIVSFIVIFMAWDVNRLRKEGYSIDELQISMAVDSNGDCTVQEHMQTMLEYRGLDVDRVIPFFEILTDVDGRKSFHYNRILESSFSDRIGVGIRNATLPVTKEYALGGKADFDYSYTMNTAQINRTESASVLLDLISAGNKVLIHKVSFSLELPTQIQQGKVQFYLVDEKRHLTEITPQYRVSGKRIEGTYSQDIQEHTGLAVRVLCDEGTFVTSFTEQDICLLVLTALITVIGFLIWFIWGRSREPVIDTVEMEPPFDMNCLEAAWIYKGHIVAMDVLAMFLYMAGKGYVRVEKRYSKFRRKKEYVFFLEKNYDGDNPVEREFMSIMYPGNRAVVYEEDLKWGTGGSLDKFVDYVKKAYAEWAIFKDCCIRGRLYYYLSIILLLIAHFIFGESLVYGTLAALVLGMFRMFAATIILAFSIFIKDAFRGRKGAVLKCTAYALIAAVIIWRFPLYVYSSIPRMLCRILLPVAAILLQLWFLRHMNRRNQDAMMLNGMILGYRKYLMNVEKSRIEILMQDNPELFYTVFSYAYVLDVSWKWMVGLEDVVFPIRDENELF